MNQNCNKIVSIQLKNYYMDKYKKCPESFQYAKENLKFIIKTNKATNPNKLIVCKV